jgi:hypothetical protein
MRAIAYSASITFVCCESEPSITLIVPAQYTCSACGREYEFFLEGRIMAKVIDNRPFIDKLLEATKDVTKLSA